MSEWKNVRLGEVADVKGGKRLPAGMMLTEEPTNHPYIRIRDLTDVKNLEITTAFQYVTDDVQQRISRYIVDEGDVLISIVGTVGLVSIVGCSLIGANLTENCVKVINLKELDNNYLYYYLKSASGQYQIRNLTVGAVQPKLPITNILSIQLPLPPLSTQRKIAAVLSSLDDKIENNRKICANLEAQAQAIFKSWFVDFEPFGGKMPQGWKMEPLEGMAERIASGGTPRTKEESYYKGLIRWYSTKELKDCFLFDSEKHISEDAVANSAAKVFPRNTILMAIYAAPTVGRLGILDSESTFNQAAVGIVARREIGYAYLYLQLLNAREGLNLMAVGSCQQNLNVGVVKSYQVLRPDNVILCKFNNLVDGLFDEIRALTKGSRSLAAMRDALLPKLMSGEIDVEKVEVA